MVEPAYGAGRDEHPLAGHAVGVGGDDRREHGRRDEPKQADQADGDRAALGEGDQADGHREGPLGGEGGAEGQQRASHGAVAEELPVAAHPPMLTQRRAVWCGAHPRLLTLPGDTPADRGRRGASRGRTKYSGSDQLIAASFTCRLPEGSFSGTCSSALS